MRSAFQCQACGTVTDDGYCKCWQISGLKTTECATSEKSTVIVPFQECQHEWLHSHGMRTVCRRCGRDGWIYLDVDPTHEIHGLKMRANEDQHRIDGLRSEIEQLRKDIESIKCILKEWIDDEKEQMKEAKPYGINCPGFNQALGAHDAHKRVLAELEETLIGFG